MLLPSALLSSFLFTLVAAAPNKKITLESQTLEARAENDQYKWQEWKFGDRSGYLLLATHGLSGNNMWRSTVYTRQNAELLRWKTTSINAFILEQYGSEELAEGNGRRSICPPDERPGSDMRRQEV
ncbi:uncharacterized protein IAS62_003748 [Cryptococcus decagattii]|uniref:Uncharacterized protein n=1 Tax=Cryptococcus decagattii TaxID=1859122 RepID=A0ABZ2AV60_9TREE